MGSKVIAYTDNNPVAHLQTARLGATEQKWIAQLAAFDYEVKYRSGRENANADALSRFPVETPVADVAAVTGTDVEMAQVQCMEEWQTKQREDEHLEVVRRYVENGEFPTGSAWRAAPPEVKRLLQQRPRLVQRDVVLCRRVIDYNTHEARFQIICPTLQCKGVEETS